jgi:hypothetical protein
LLQQQQQQQLLFGSGEKTWEKMGRQSEQIKSPELLLQQQLQVLTEEAAT